MTHPTSSEEATSIVACIGYISQFGDTIHRRDIVGSYSDRYLKKKEHTFGNATGISDDGGGGRAQQGVVPAHDQVAGLGEQE